MLRVTAIISTVVVLAAWIAAQIATDSPATATVAWVGFVAIGWLIPGAAVVRAVRHEPATVGDDLGWAIVAGAPLTLLGWLVCRLTGLPDIAWGPAVTAGLLLLPRTRHRILSRPGPQVQHPGAIAAIAGCLLVAVSWMTGEFLRWVPALPGPGFSYYPDLLFQLALVGETGHSIPPQNPTVAGLPLDYHWFTHAVTAHAAAAAHVDPAPATLRFMPTTLVLGTALAAATVARTISGRPWSGPVATALLLVGGESGGTAWRATVPALSMVHTNWWASLTQTFGDLIVVGTIGLLVGILREPRGSAVPVVLLAPVVVMAAGVKSTILPVVLCGLIAASGIAVLHARYRVAIRAAVTAAGVAVVLVGATYLLYDGRSYGTVIAPLAGARSFAATLVPGLSGHLNGAPLATGTTLPLATTLALTAFWLAVGTARWVGLIALVGRRSSDPVTWLLCGTVVAGVLATLLVRHPGGSEAYFLRTVFPIGVVGSAAGLALIFTDRREPGSVHRGSAHSLPRASVALATAVFVAGALGCPVVLGP